MLEMICTDNTNPVGSVDFLDNPLSRVDWNLWSPMEQRASLNSLHTSPVPSYAVCLLSRDLKAGIGHVHCKQSCIGTTISNGEREPHR